MKKFLTGAFALLMFLSFTATTVSALPPGLAKRGDENNRNLPPGLQRRVNNLPPGIQKKLLNVQWNKEAQQPVEYEAVVYRVDVDGLSIVVRGEDNRLVRFPVLDGVEVTHDEDTKKLDFLLNNDEVKLTLDKDGVVIKIQVTKLGGENGTIDYGEVEGSFYRLRDSNRKIQIRVGSATPTYDLDENVRVWIDGVQGNRSNLKADMPLVLWLEDNVVIEIDADSVNEYRNGDYDVRLLGISIASERTITVRFSNNERREFKVDKDVPLETLVDTLELEEDIRIRLQNGVVTRVW